MPQKSYQMVGKLLGDGLITIKKEVRELLRLSKGDLIRLTVEKLEPTKIQELA